MSDVPVKRGAELSTDHHLVVCTLKALKPLKKRKTFRPRETYRIKWESLADEEVYKLHLQTTLHVSSKNFRSLLKTLKLSGVYFEQQSLRPLLTVVNVGGTKSSEKRTPWWNQEVKEAIRPKKIACKAWLANKSSVELRSQYSEARKVAATKVKLPKERAWKEFGERLDDDFKTANKVFWQTIRRLRGKRSRAAFFIEDSNGVTLKDQDAILNRWRDYFGDLLNPVDATPTQIHEEQVGEDIQITEADVNAVIKSLKTGKAPGEDDIRPEMLKQQTYMVFVG